MTIWYFVYIFLTVQLVITVAMLLPLPRFVHSQLVRLVFQIRKASIIFGLLYCWLIYNAYIGFTVKYPYTKVEQAKTIDQYIMIMKEHFREQRNFYIASFALTTLFVIIRIAAILGQNLALSAPKPPVVINPAAPAVAARAPAAPAPAANNAAAAKKSQ